MAELDNNLDLLDLDDDASIDGLPASDPFASAPRPKKPWLLFGAALVVIILATYIIIRTVGTDSDSSVEINLDTPEVAQIETPNDTLVVPPTPAPAAAPVQETAGTPTRTVSDRAEVKFNPDKVSAPVATKPAAKPVVKKPVAATPASGGWYVQFGSYSTRALAESAQKRINAQHGALFSGKQFVILAAVLPNGSTTYRLRVAFASSADANGFCRNAKSDGLECYVAR
ncbi:MAG: SPOR domain-containing protein [Rickettsiales bacterium]|jgi:cell division protein FtsN|nr:SPOR domain-containing protein [Rickettsiales bacterium]